MYPSSYKVFCTLLVIETPGTECYMKRGIFTPVLCIIIPFIKIPCPMGLQGIRLVPERVQVQSSAHVAVGGSSKPYTTTALKL